MKKLLTAMALVFAVGTAVPVSAQSQAEIALKVERLEREMIALENRLRGGQGAVPSVSSGPVDPADRSLMGDLVAKVGSLESQLRSINGRLEELEYKQRQMDEAVELLRKEMTLQAQETAQAQAEMKAQISSSSSSDAGPATTTTAPASVAPAIELPDADPAAQYRYAFEFIQKNDLDNGFKAMDLFLKANPKDERAGNAKFWLGRIHLLKGRMPQAAQQLLALIEEHPNHDKRPDALLDLADVLIALDSAPDACNALAEFRRMESKANDRLIARAKKTAQTAGCSY